MTLKLCPLKIYQIWNFLLKDINNVVKQDPFNIFFLLRPKNGRIMNPLPRILEKKHQSSGYLGLQQSVSTFLNSFTFTFFYFCSFTSSRITTSDVSFIFYCFNFFYQDAVVEIDGVDEGVGRVDDQSPGQIGGNSFVAKNVGILSLKRNLEKPFFILKWCSFLSLKRNLEKSFFILKVEFIT